MKSVKVLIPHHFIISDIESAFPSTKRVKKGIKMGVTDLLHQQIREFQKARSLPKPGIINKISSSALKSQTTLSEGSIPFSGEDTATLVTTARAQQFRRLIQLILTRDRAGLASMGRSVNIPALLGVVHFDPDNYQVNFFILFGYPSV